MKAILLDNFDSFSYNLADYFRQCGVELLIYRNDVPVNEWEQGADFLILSPGPGRPAQAGCMMDAIEAYAERLPILGVCLGLQAIVEHFGGQLENLAPMHGKESQIQCDQKGIYEGLPTEITIGRYHSLGCRKVPECLAITAKTDDHIVMSVQHRTLPIYAVQYHPESVLSQKREVGMRIIKNFLTQIR